jgi:hypothetical protein
MYGCSKNWIFYDILEFNYIQVIDDVIREINSNKAIGWDLIHPRYYKD